MRQLDVPETPLTAPYWEATRRRELLLQWCRDCDAAVYYPRAVCPTCLGEDLEWRTASGRGEVYAFTVHHKAQHPAFEDLTPYVVALVDLAEGARVLSNVVGCPPGEVRVGQPVTVTWEELPDGRALPLFEPI